jgi:hypothetical protein
MYFSDALPEKYRCILIPPLRMLVRKIWIFIYNDTLRAIDPVALKTANDDLGFTQNNFLKCIQNPTDADLHYLETALPIRSS